MRKSQLIATELAIAVLAALYLLHPAVSCASADSDLLRISKPFDIQAYIDSQIALGKTRIVIPPGSYRVEPRNRQHLLLHGLTDITIEAAGVEMICIQTTRALTIHNCRNLTIHGMTIDYDPLPYTQGRIVRLAQDSLVHEIELFEGYPPAEQVKTFKYEIFRSDTRTLRFGSYYDFTVEKLSHNRIRVTKSDSYRNHRPEQPGDIIAIGTAHAPDGSIPHAVYLNKSANVTLEDIRLYASNCFGFFETNCDASTYLRCIIDRRPPRDDFRKRADARIRSLDADAFHSKHAVKGPAVIECTARFQGDDCINICGDYHMIMSSQKNRLRVLAKHSMNIQPGDSVELVTYDGKRLPDARAIAVEPDGGIRPNEREFLSKQRMNESLRTTKGALNDAFTITLDRDVEMEMGGVICSAGRIGNGFEVRGCTFGYNRSRGILIKASRGRVCDNHIEASRMSAILVKPEYWWLEAGSSSDLLIHDNTITACGEVSICIEATGGSGQTAPAGAHRNISILRNTITKSPMPGILVTSTSELNIADNHLDLLDTDAIPGPMRQSGMSELRPIVKINCRP